MAFLRRGKATAAATDPDSTHLCASSAAWLTAALAPPVALSAFFFAWAFLRFASRLTGSATIRQRGAAARRRRAPPFLPRFVACRGLAATVPEKVPRPVALWQQRHEGPSRDIDVQIDAGNGASSTSVVKIDGLSPGGALLHRADCCLGGNLKSLTLPNGDLLNLDKSLKAQGIQDGSVLSAELSAVPQAAKSEPLFNELAHFSFTEYVSEVMNSQDRFEVTISARQEPVLRDIEEHMVRADFEEDRVTLRIRVRPRENAGGNTADYVFRRRFGARGALRHDALPVGFKVCPERCSYVVTPRKKIQLTFRPFPDDWLSSGTAVLIHDLKEAQELNGQRGTISAYVECQGKFLPERYCVRLDSSGEVKRFKRANLTPLQCKSRDGDAPAAPGCGPDPADAAAGSGTPSSSHEMPKIDE